MYTDINVYFVAYSFYSQINKHYFKNRRKTKSQANIDKMEKLLSQGVDEADIAVDQRQL